MVQQNALVHFVNAAVGLVDNLHLVVHVEPLLFLAHLFFHGLQQRLLGGDAVEEVEVLAETFIAQQLFRLALA